MKLFILITLILSFGAVGFAQKQIESDHNVYRDEEFRFSVFYPKDWTQLQPSYAQTRFKATKEDGFYFTDFSINCIYAEVNKDLSSEEMVKLFDDPKFVLALIKQGNPTSKLISSGKTYISNREAYFIKSEATFRTFDSQKELTLYQIVTIDKGTTYTLTFRSPTDEFDDNFPTFKFIASSFVIRPVEIKVAPSTTKRSSKN